jgi:hypothetical protein
VSEEEEKAFQNKDDLAPLDTCLSLADAIGEANIVFVDTPAELQDCADYLLKQPVVGLDTEWKAIHVSPRRRASSVCTAPASIA